MTFYGREREIKLVNRLFGRKGMQVGLLYGRRRVGKSELIKHCLLESEYTGIYYECKQTTEKNNVENICELIGEEFDFPKPDFSNTEKALDWLFRKSEKEPVILVLDEYPYLREVVKGMDSILQSLIDKYQDQCQLKLILCGSYVDIMKSLVFEENPLYGRIDQTISLKPMDYYESALFYPEFSAEDKVRLYSVFGGIPFYNRQIDPSLSVRENIIELIASPDARLQGEVGLYLNSEIARINNANEVFDALTKGYSKYSDILTQSHVSSSPMLANILEKLIRMDVVKKEAPINDENNKKKAGYYITDNFTLFYYRYIFRYSSRLKILDSDVFYDRYIAQDFETQYVPKVFEEVCRQYLIRRNKSGQIDIPFDKIGKYWYDNPKEHTNGEFDIVTEDPNGYTFYEAKFRKEPITEKMIAEELAQVEKTGMNCTRYGFFSKSGFEAEEKENIMLVDISQLYH